jgi:hypothetical protein
MNFFDLINLLFLNLKLNNLFVIFSYLQNNVHKIFIIISILIFLLKDNESLLQYF